MDVAREQVGVHDARTGRSKLPDRVAGGEELIITRHGEPAALLSPPPGRRRVTWGWTRGEVDRARTALGARGLPVTDRHASAVHDLPLHHRDPFDRLLVATAQVEDVALATTDVAPAAHDVPLVTP